MAAASARRRGASSSKRTQRTKRSTKLAAKQVKRGVIVQRGKLGSTTSPTLQRASIREEPLTPMQRENLVLKYRLKARKLGRSILRRWHSRLDLQEVDSVVDLSLCEAVRRFNPKKGASFMTFLYYHLRGNLIRAVAQAANMNAVPAGDLSSPLHNGDGEEVQAREGSDANGHLASAVEIAQALCSQDFLSPEEVLFKKELNSLGVDACARLDPLEREVIERIYLKEQQLMDIAQSLGYSRCHISRVKKKALDTLQTDLNDYVETAHTSTEEVEESAAERDAVLAERRKIHRRRPRSASGARLFDEELAFDEGRGSEELVTAA